MVNFPNNKLYEYIRSNGEIRGPKLTDWHSEVRNLPIKIECYGEQNTKINHSHAHTHPQIRCQWITHT